MMGAFGGFRQMKFLTSCVCPSFTDVTMIADSTLSIALLSILSTLGSALVIDDSQWNTPQLQLSDGWNMLRPDQTEAIDLFQVDLMRPLLPMFFNRSIRYVLALCDLDVRRCSG